MGVKWGRGGQRKKEGKNEQNIRVGVKGGGQRKKEGKNEQNIRVGVKGGGAKKERVKMNKILEWG